MKSPLHFLTKFISAVAALALTSCVARPPAAVSGELAERVGRKPELAVLFVGNSYSFGVPKAFAKLAAQRGKNVETEQVTHSGWTLSRHSGSTETLRKIRSKRWDVIVFQEQSRIPSSPARRRFLMFPSLRKLSAEARGQGAVPILYQTWGHRDGDRKRPGDDFHAMTSRVRDGYRLAAENAGGLTVIPVGDAWEREVTAGQGALLFMPDGSHPTPRGNALTAEAFYEVLFGR